MIPVYFVLTRGLVLLDLAGPAEAFRVAERLCPGTFALHFCGPEAELECGLAGLHWRASSRCRPDCPPTRWSSFPAWSARRRGWTMRRRAPSSTGWPRANRPTASR